MEVSKTCRDCLINSQIRRANKLEKKEEYLERVQYVLDHYDGSAPYLSYYFDKEFVKYGTFELDYPTLKRQYNDLVLNMESDIEKVIESSKDPLKTSIVFSRIGNYIDFAALDHVDSNEFLKLLEEGNQIPLDESTYSLFIQKCNEGNTFMILCDNCGEIVLDKLFIKQLKKRFPHLTIYALVRGGEVINDATMIDAKYCGMDQECIVLDTGYAASGTCLKLMKEDTKSILLNSDVILSKGQGNYEGISGEALDIFYSFLCKCDVFASRFNVPRLTGMFVYEGKKV